MGSLDIAAVAGLVVVAFCIATAALIATSHFVAKGKAINRADFDVHDAEPAVFIFDAELLVDATDPARRFLRKAGKDGTHWDQLMSILTPSFPDIEPDIQGLARGETLDLWSNTSAAHPMRVFAEWHNGMRRIKVVQTEDAEAVVTMDAQNLFGMERDVALLHALAESAPCLIWKTRQDDGTLTWANSAYLKLARRILGDTEAMKYPPPRLFAPLQKVEDARTALQRRVSVDHPDEDIRLWFDTESRKLEDETLHFAITADSAVQAEGALREFIQTLAKTFAHLPIGLAIFSRDRRLALFNPAMTDLSTLPVDFLSARPSLSAFLDELRNRQVMPEPKDYISWRQRITTLEDEAEKGTYAETWSLASGQTYRVTGRPHPEGALAFLFEDISYEVTLTRRFRAEMALGQSVIDAVPDAMAVFSANGTLALSNTAYNDLWGMDSRSTIGEVSVIDASRVWAEACAPTPIWGDIRDFVATMSERAEWGCEASLKCGQALICRVAPLPGGNTLVAFTPTGAALQKTPAEDRGVAPVGGLI